MSESNFEWSEKNVDEFLYLITKNTNWVHSQLCEWKSEFKKSKEVKPDFEIIDYLFLPLKDKKVVSTVDAINYNGWDLNSPEWAIHSVRRLLDGLGFSVGDVDEKWGKIIKFKIENNGMLAYFEYGDAACWTELWKLQKVKPKEVLLTTSLDNKIVYEGGIFYAVHKREFTELQCRHKLGQPELWETALEMKVIDDYILNNKPVMVSLKEVLGSIPSTYINSGDTLVRNMCDYITAFFKNKINP